MEDEVYLDEAMFENDKLFEVKGDISRPPHNHIGAITFNTKLANEVGKGTGILISQDVVLTAAHNLLRKSTSQCYSNFKFFPGASGPLQKGYEVEDVFLPGKYILHPIINNDYALLKLKEKVPTENFIPLSGDISKVTNQITLSIFGYPGETYVPTNQFATEFEAKQCGLSKPGRVMEIIKEKSELRHTISTKGGQSGAPIITRDNNGNLMIVAIHTSEVASKKEEGKAKFNSARLITNDLINTIRIETQRMGGSQPVNTAQQLEQQQQLINQLLQVNDELQNKNQALNSKLSAMEKTMMPEKSQQLLKEMEQKLKLEIEKVERLTLELQRQKLKKQPQHKPMQIPTAIEGHGYKQTTTQLSEMVNRGQITHLSITDTVNQAKFSLYQPDDPARMLVSIKGTFSATQTYFPVNSELGGTSPCSQPKFADELSHFTALQSLTFSFKHNQFSRKCFTYLVEKINGLKNLQSVELRIPKKYQKDEQKENWTRKLKVKSIVTYY